MGSKGAILGNEQRIVSKNANFDTFKNGQKNTIFGHFHSSRGEFLVFHPKIPRRGLYFWEGAISLEFC